jgi:hypothetical protein
MDPQLEALVTSLLYEGYALYPYTPRATKNSTPTPFGIVYPPAYAENCDGAFDHLRIDCALTDGDDARLSAEIRFLQPAGERHQAMPRRIELDGPGEQRFDFGAVCGRVRLRDLGDRARVCVHNETPFDQTDADRSEALRHSLLSTHVVLRAEGGRFTSPIESPGDNVNTWPVLASPEDDAVLGAAIVLPDHPQLSSKSRGDLFDGTEIEEALLLHVHALSDGERAEISEQDPAVRAMVARAAAATPADLFDLHASMEPSNFLGEHEMTVDDRRFVRGGKVVLRLGQDGDPHDAILDGRLATIERIYVDYDDHVHLGVTVDDDPGSDVMRSSGRYLFFKPEEVEIR